MSKPKIATTQDLTILLRARGPITGPEIIANLKISQPTLSRLVRESKDSILRIDTGRPPLYAVIRQVRNLGNPIPLFSINAQGKSISLGALIPIHPHGYVFQDQAKSQVFGGIPYFLSDNRPQGFIGKTFPTKNSDLHLPARLQDWSEDDFMEAICRRGEDSVGNIIIGKESFERFQSQRLNPKELLKSSERIEYYVEAANNSLASDHPGSSVAGEQPKFTASYDQNGQLNNVLVKFSPKLDTPVNRRWADLLIAESIALEILDKGGIASCKGKILEADNRVFLESARFDRIGRWGRIGVISLASIDDEFWGSRDSWYSASFRLERDGFLSKEDAKKMRIQSSFGDLIGNTDQHFGNISFYFEVNQKPLRITPAYDVLPMLYAPVNNELIEREFKVANPNADDIDSWNQALPLALKFWTTLVEFVGISEDFRTIAKKNLTLLKSVSL